MIERIPEPCLCGDPECRRCFPETLFVEDEEFEEDGDLDDDENEIEFEEDDDAS